MKTVAPFGLDQHPTVEREVRAEASEGASSGGGVRRSGSSTA